MGRYSPTVAPDSGGGGFAQSLLGGLQAFMQGRRQKKADAQADRQAELQDLVQRGELSDQGYREGQAPTREERIGIDTPDNIARPPENVFEGARPGMGEAGPSPLSMGMRQMAQRGLQRPAAAAGPAPEPELLAHPGSFVPGLGFTSKALFQAPPMPQQAAGFLETADPRYEQLTPGWYRDSEGTPEARATQAAGQKRNRLAAALEQIGQAKPGQGGGYADALEGGVPGSVLFDDEEKPQTRAQRRAALAAAGVPENVLDAATDDEAIARSYLEKPDPVDPKPWAPQTQEERIALEEALGRIRAKYRAPTQAESERGRFTANQAMEQLQELYAVRNEFGDVTGFSMDEQEMFDFAERMAAGEDVDLPEPESQPGGSIEEPLEAPAPGWRGALQRFLPGGNSGYRPAQAGQGGNTPGAAPEQGPGTTSRRPARQISDAELRRLLDAGYSIDEIEKRVSSSGG